MESMTPRIGDIRPWLESITFLAISIFSAYLCRSVISSKAQSWASRADSKITELFVTTLRAHVPLWMILAGISAATQTSPFLEYHQTLINKAVLAVFFISVTLALSRFVAGAIGIFASRHRGTSATTQLAANLSQIAVVGIGAMMILSNLGVSITPLLTALGVSSLAVALALQDTLANFFAGIHIVASNLAEVGDYIRLDTGQEGSVVEVGWRTTRIRDLSNKYIFVPNVKLAQSIIVNFQKPEPEIAVIVPMSVGLSADLAQVERVALEAASVIQKDVPGAVPHFQPLVRFNAFSESGIQFSVILHVRSFPDRFLVLHEFIKKAHESFRKEGIGISHPQRTVHLKQTA